MSVKTIYSDKELVDFIDSATPEELKDYFKENIIFHNINSEISVNLDCGLSFIASPLAYSLFSDKTSASHVQALIDCGATLDKLELEILQFYGPDMDDHNQFSYNPFEEASADKVDVLNRAIEWINRKYTDTEVYDLITKDNSSSISDYFGRHDPNEEITWEYPEKNLRYVGSICGLAAFDEKVNVYAGFVQILDKGGDPNVLCRVENIDNPENVDVLTVTELCHSVDKINRALDYGGLPTQHLLEGVLYGIKDKSAHELHGNELHFFNKQFQASREQASENRRRRDEASENLRLLMPLELRLVTDHPDIFEAHHMHGMANPQAVAEMLLMGHDSGVVNEDGQSLMLSSLLSGKFEVFDVLQRFGVESGSEGERPMDLVVKHFDCVREAHVPGGDFEDWQRCERAIAHLVQTSEDPTADLASYLKIGRFPDAHEVAQLIDRGAVMSDEAQRKYMSPETYAIGDEKEKVQQALNRQQRDVILAEVGEVYTPPTMRRKM
ncbi:hypothetical protein predicted by Glimmer/Critica [Stenotrophomonas maltophilia RA8]|uniref:hypothetical protein n=1 Tax=Stenotrophomonas maltophilia TaxID=40324 RepID=UPI0002C5419A|nr:hypothetical protein [Stenotrophomonas maltophilia]MCD5965568.1 hypothetical protein [Stenotrophomonas maltophilia]QGL75297.1 hypothetical protein FEO95_06500 [Stenotrophomonas maltophilia]CCP15447.1 hypothetical protein predicted by Glimmer/Critica [Stenotrophomonas maltophilia RA8]